MRTVLGILLMDDWWPSSFIGVSYTKVVDASFVPSTGEMVELWPDGPMHEVRHRYLAADGSAGVVLKNVVVDSKHELPTPNIQSFWRNHTTWWSVNEGEKLDSLLIANGWKAFSTKSST